MACIHYTLDIIASGNPNFLYLFIIALIVPCCGYIGAKTKNICCISVFTLCNLFHAALMFFSLCFLTVWMFMLIKAKTWCNDHPTATSYDGPESSYMKWFNSEESDCADIINAHWSTMAVGALVGALSLLLSGLACIWGKALQDHHCRKGRVPEIVVPHNIRTEPLLVQQIEPDYEHALVVTDAVIVNV